MYIVILTDIDRLCGTFVVRMVAKFPQIRPRNDLLACVSDGTFNLTHESRRNSFRSIFFGRFFAVCRCVNYLTVERPYRRSDHRPINSIYGSVVVTCEWQIAGRRRHKVQFLPLTSWDGDCMCDCQVSTTRRIALQTQRYKSGGQSKK